MRFPCKAVFTGNIITDVEFISKNKRARTVRSGVAPVLPSSGPENQIRELFGASVWWTQALDEFWKTAAQSKILIPKMLAEQSKMSSQLEVNTEWLMEVTQNLPEYKASLRKGVTNEYEKLALGHIQGLVKQILETTTVEEANAKGFTDLLPPLRAAFDVLTPNAAVSSMKEKVSAWYSSLQGGFAMQSFSQEVSKVENAGDGDHVDWGSLYSKMSDVNKSDITEELLGRCKDILGPLANDLALKVPCKRCF